MLSTELPLDSIPARYAQPLSFLQGLDRVKTYHGFIIEVLKTLDYLCVPKIPLSLSSLSCCFPRRKYESP